MARINTNVGALVAQRHLNSAYRQQNETIQHLSSGLRISRGADDPAGLIASERLRSEISAVNQAVDNTKRASLIISTTEGALDEVARLLIDIQDLIVESANEGALSQEEIEANQLQIDSAIASITRIANTTTFAGKQLLNGSLDYITSGLDTTMLDSVKIHSAQFGTRDYIPVNVDVVQSAQPAQLFFRSGAIAQTVSFSLQGELGVDTLTFVSGTPASAMVAAINAVRDATGLSATLSANATSGFVINSTAVGSRKFAQIELLPGSGPFALTDATGVAAKRDTGRDATATVNGALTRGDGNRLTLKTGTLDLELQLDQSVGNGSTSFSITSGGALFQVGPRVNSSLQVNLGVGSVAATELGNGELGFLSQVVSGGDFSLLNGEYQSAQRIAELAINQVSVLRGRLGAFERNTLDPNVNQLSITAENLASAQSAIRDADFAMETSELSRNQILVQSGTSVLAIANQTPQSILQLLQ